MHKPAFFAVLAVSIVLTAASLGVSASRYLSSKYYVPPPAPAARGLAPVDGKGGRATGMPADGQAPRGPAVPGSAPAEPAGAGASAPATPPERWTNVFAPSQGMDIPSKLAKSKGEETAPETRYVLIGTIASETRASRRAILWAEGMREPRMLRESDELEPRVRVAVIERDFVWLARGKRKERLDLLPVGSRARLVAPPAAPMPATGRAHPSQAIPGLSGEGPPLRVSKLAENVYSLDESAVGQLTGNINHYMTQVRLIPYFEGNKSAGYRLAAIRPGSAFEQLGFRGGDIIQQVNGVELSSPEKMYTIFQNLKDEKRVAVDIVRQGQKNTITYEIR